MGITIFPSTKSNYQNVLDQMQKVQDKAGQDQGVTQDDTQSLRNARSTYSQEPGIDTEKLRKSQELRNDVSSMVDADKKDGSDNAQWQQIVNEINQLIRQFAPGMHDDTSTNAPQSAATSLHAKYVSMILADAPSDPSKRLNDADVKGMKDYLSANQGNLDPSWVAQAQNVVNAASSSDEATRPTYSDLSSLSAEMQEITALQGSGATGTTVTPVSDADKFALSELNGNTNAIAKIDGNPKGYIEDIGANYQLYNGKSDQIAFFAKSDNAIIGLNNNSWLQLAPRGFDPSTTVTDAIKEKGSKSSAVRRSEPMKQKRQRSPMRAGRLFLCLPPVPPPCMNLQRGITPACTLLIPKQAPRFLCHQGCRITSRKAAWCFWMARDSI